MSGASCCSQDWGHGMEHVHGFPSVTFYPKAELFSHDPLTQDMDCPLALWWLLFLVIPLVMVVIRLVFCSLPNFIFHLKLPCITIYKLMQTWIKYPCSTRDLGPPHPFSLHFLFVDSCPQVLVCQEDHNKWHLNRDLEYALGKRTEWLWTYWGR